MNYKQGNWLSDFAASAEKTDRFAGTPDHMRLLATGMLGEAGSVVAELKKKRRELEAYVAYRNRMLEEIGDFLWYYVRIVTLLNSKLLEELPSTPSRENREVTESTQLSHFLLFGQAVGKVMGIFTEQTPATARDTALREVWDLLTTVSHECALSLSEAAETTILKTTSRWPAERIHHALFDTSFPEEEQLPRRLEIDFIERSRDNGKAVVLRCNGINFGDRLTDNIEDADGYRYHDIFHFAHAAHLGWSPVVRSLLRCKRKSNPAVDEAQDGARAAIIEEAAAAIIFSRAKHLRFFDQINHVDFDILKTVKGFVEGFEVASVSLWQWEEAILEGYRVFRLLRDGHGGRVALDLDLHRLKYSKRS